MKIAVINTVTSEFIQTFCRDKIDIIIFAKIDKTVDYFFLSSNFKLVNAFENPTESNWYNYNLVAVQLAKLKLKLPVFFSFKGYDLESALKKDLLWAFLVDYALLFQMEKLKSSENSFVLYNKRRRLRKRLALVKKLFFYQYSAYSLQISNNIDDLKGKVAIRLNSVSLIAIYGKLFEKIGRKNIVSFQTSVVANSTISSNKAQKVFSSSISSKSTQKNIFKLKFHEKIKLLFMKGNADFFNALIYNSNCLRNHINEYEKLCQSGINKILVNASENEGEGNVLCAVANKYGVTTYNYMNGTKARDPQNVEVKFDYWFMPDQKTKELISSYSNMKGKQLPVTGHLLHEVAEEYIYSGTLESFSSKMANKKVIALFTSKIFINEKIEMLRFFQTYLKKHEDLVVLVRKHPDELTIKDITDERIIQLPSFSPELFQNSLFDLFLKANVAISFSSTVSFQATWFNIPSFNYEVSQESRLPFIDNESVFHINNLIELEKRLDDYLYNGCKVPVNSGSLKASENISAIIKDSETT